MKSPTAVFALLAASALFAASCGRNNDVPVPNTSATATKGADPAAPGAMPQVEPVVPKGAEAPSPKPGQANDHSSPGFKTGGKTDPSK